MEPTKVPIYEACHPPAPKVRNGEARVESQSRELVRIDKHEAEYFRAPDLADDIIFDDARRAAFTTRDLAFEDDGLGAIAILKL